MAIINVLNANPSNSKFRSDRHSILRKHIPEILVLPTIQDPYISTILKVISEVTTEIRIYFYTITILR